MTRAGRVKERVLAEVGMGKTGVDRYQTSSAVRWEVGIAIDQPYLRRDRSSDGRRWEGLPSGLFWKEISPHMSALSSLPHGPEFRFVDTLVAMEPGKSALGHYLVRGDESFLAGHFPGNPMMPGVILIEAIAQLGGVVAQSDTSQRPLDDLRLAGVANAKITGPALPGELLEIQVEIEGRMGSLIQVKGRVATGGRKLASAKVTLSGV